MWTPRWIVLIVRNVRDFEDIRAFGKVRPEEVPLDLLERPYRLGCIVSAAALFDADTSVESLAAAAFTMGAPIECDLSESIPLYRMRYRIIDAFEQQEQSDVACVETHDALAKPGADLPLRASPVADRDSGGCNRTSAPGFGGLRVSESGLPAMLWGWKRTCGTGKEATA